MKTVTKNNRWERVDDVEAKLRVKAGWKYCPKSEWKENVRDFDKPKKSKKDDN